MTPPSTTRSALPGQLHAGPGDVAVERFAHHGLAAVRLQSAHVEAVILPGKGADLCSFRSLATNTQMLAERTDAPAIAQTFRERGAVGYGDCFIGGWPSLLPSRARRGDFTVGPHQCGEAATVAFDAFDSLILDAYRLICSADLPLSGLRVVRTFGFDSTGRTLEIRVNVTNRSASTVEFHWTEHPTFGRDLLSGDFEFLLPPCTAHHAPDDPERAERSERVQFAGRPPCDLRALRLQPGDDDLFCTLRGPSGGWVAIFNAARGSGVHLRWDPTLLPAAWYWQSHRAGERMLAVEPSNSHRTELCDDPAGPALRLEPGASMSTRMMLSVIDADGAGRLRQSLSTESSAAFSGAFE